MSHRTKKRVVKERTLSESSAASKDKGALSDKEKAAPRQLIKEEKAQTGAVGITRQCFTC